MTTSTDQHPSNSGSLRNPKQGADSNEDKTMANTKRKNARSTSRKASSKARSAPKRDIQQEIADKIVAILDSGAKPWAKPWESGAATYPLRANGAPYRGVNVLVLWMAAVDGGFSSPYWMTYRQAVELGGQVRKGERGTGVIKYGTYEKKAEGANAPSEPAGKDGDDTVRRGFLRGYTVFNASQIDGLPERFHPAVPAPGALNERIAVVDAWLTTVGADIRHGGNAAYYAPTPDYVQMPEFRQFPDAELYYATLMHELTHWTRHTSRLARDFGREQYGDEGYAKEELTAEIGSAFLGAMFGFRPDHIDRHAGYIESWAKRIRDDRRFFFTACAAAQKAVDFLAPPVLAEADDEDSADMHEAA